MMRRRIEDEVKKNTFMVDVTPSNVEIVVYDGDRKLEQRMSISMENADHLMGLLSEALYGMRRRLEGR